VSARKVAGVPKHEGRKAKPDGMTSVYKRLKTSDPYNQPTDLSRRGRMNLGSAARIVKAFKDLDLMEVSDGDCDGGL
jgi:hypothetical protein